MRQATLWRWPLRIAVALMLVAGPAQSWDLTGAVSTLSLAAVALATIAVPLGLWSLRCPEPGLDPVPATGPGVAPSAREAAR